MAMGFGWEYGDSIEKVIQIGASVAMQSIYHKQRKGVEIPH